MIKIENIDVYGWEAAIRGMRNSMNSWDKSDTIYGTYYGKDENGCEVFTKDGLTIGENDLALMKKLSAAGTDHAKFLRMINVTMDITSPTFWWSEFDTYKVSTVRNSCSKMHKIHIKPFEYDDFTHEGCDEVEYAKKALEETILVCERLRNDFNRTQEKKYWRALIELLPEGFNMRATVQLNYAVLKNMYFARRNHKLDEWRIFCETILSLPYFEAICVDTEEVKL